MSKKAKNILPEEEVSYFEDDAEAAFWDEFFYSYEKSDEDTTGKRYTIRIIDEETGDEVAYEGIKLKGEFKKLD